MSCSRNQRQQACTERSIANRTAVFLTLSGGEKEKERQREPCGAGSSVPVPWRRGEPALAETSVEASLPRCHAAVLTAGTPQQHCNLGHPTQLQYSNRGWLSICTRTVQRTAGAQLGPSHAVRAIRSGDRVCHSLHFSSSLCYASAHCVSSCPVLLVILLNSSWVVTAHTMPRLYRQ